MTRSGPPVRKLDSCRLCMALDLESVDELAPGVAKVHDAFPLAGGHDLVLTKNHIGSFAQAAQSGLDLSFLPEMSPEPMLLIEHGVPAMLPRLGCIDHAHVHVFPFVMAGIDELFSSSALSFARESKVTQVEVDELGRTVGTADYIWIVDSSQRSVVIEPNTPAEVPAQLARRVVAEILGLRRWDWRRELALRSARNLGSVQQPDAGVC